MLIGELGKRTGISIDTIRFYERKGLLQPARVASNNYKHYDDNSLQRLDIIIKSKQLGFTLSEIKVLLDKLESADFSLESKARVVDEKLEDIDTCIHELNDMRQMLLKIKSDLTSYACSEEYSVSTS